MAVVTISRQLGSLGTEIARKVSERTGYRYLDRESLEVLLVGHGIDRTSIERYDERKQSFWGSLSGEREKYLNYLKLAIYEFARTEQGVIVGRGGAVLLGDVPGALHVRITAPRDVRLARIMASYACSEQNAEHLLQDSDRDRAGFHRFFFNTDWHDDGLYDIVLNTGRLTADDAVDVIVRAAESCSREGREAGTAERLDDLLLAQKVLIEIIHRRRIPLAAIRVRSEEGRILLSGSVTSGKLIEECEQAARSVPGVKDVDNQLVYLSTVYSLPHGTYGT